MGEAARPSQEELRASWRAAFNDPLDLAKWRSALQLGDNSAAPTPPPAGAGGGKSAEPGNGSILRKGSVNGGGDSGKSTSWEVDWGKPCVDACSSPAQLKAYGERKRSLQLRCGNKSVR